MSGMHSTFSSSITGDSRHSYALLSATQQGSKASGSSSASPYQKDADIASISSFGSSASLLKSKLNKHSGATKSSSSSKKSSSLIARQRAAEDANTQIMNSQAAFWPSSIRHDL
ncbi:hypothetical protein BDP81DRAFT_129066 [Colletotrichum phormii]|uniref:Uncharacterized protein n=1 Tax=Colletotrichum phormii TaxID=359342 RepID=A0AAI9ZZP3_9PEZI|nr:uncharacterized protein BDP81DRAFT_129066 [Colletotrichum phormii]KAK1641191.1 hypothetical protein BDP81DRAFT_129066 [Colletotrichum phormii]